MTVQFGRVVRLRVGNLDSAIEVEGLRMSFDVTKDDTSEPNEATVSIYNLNRQNRYNLLKRGEYMELEAGYGDDTGIIYKGAVRYAIEEKNENDYVTKLYFGTADSACLTIINQCYEAGSSDSQAIKDCAAKMGVMIGHIPTSSTQYKRGRTVTGFAKNIMDNMARNADGKWSVQDDQLQVLASKKTLPNLAWHISTETGLIGSPEVTSEGMRIKCLLNRHIVVGGVVSVDSQQYKLNIKVNKITHQGDTHGSDWYSIIEGVQYG
jgi:hypothetical protein